MENISKILIAGVAAYIFILILVPVLKKIALRIGLVDLPSARKVHSLPVPLVGGIAIAITLFLFGAINLIQTGLELKEMTIFASAFILMIVGVIDDRFDINAKYKLAIQLFCAFLIAASGVRITYLFGLFGIYDLPESIQYLLTIVVICGVVNAFNLMDGIDGLAGLLSLVGFSLLSIFSFLVNNYNLMLMFIVCIGAIIGFLRFNFKEKKIFMGDAGTLFIGTLLIGFSIFFLEDIRLAKPSNPLLLYIVIGFFALPVLDSLRVYLGRLKRGVSPFKADRTHLHHLLLIAKISHKKASFIIAALTFGTLIFSLVSNQFISVSVSFLLIILFFSSFFYLLNLNKKVHEWVQKIKKIEH